MAIINLPVDVYWKLIDAASPNRMKKFCPAEFALIWWSPSLAILAFEPKPKDLTKQLSNEGISYLNMTCPISGLTISQEEKETSYWVIRSAIIFLIRNVLEMKHKVYGRW